MAASRFASVLLGAWVVAQAASAQQVSVDAEGAVSLPPLAVPFSNLASREAKGAFLENQAFIDELGRASRFMKNVPELRQMLEAHLQAALKRAEALYPTRIARQKMAGVAVEVYTPHESIATENDHRVLINLRGGGFAIGTRTVGALESMPMAALGKIKVVSLDYRQGPEHRFPAASEDVAAVYRELLNQYPARNIGIYGCSAGGMLTAEVIAWLAKENLPRPGAIGIFCASAGGWMEGDSAHLGAHLDGIARILPSSYLSPPHPSVGNSVYFAGVDFDDPLVAPIRSDAVMAKFPPTLVMTGTRDYAMSSAVHTHSRLVKLGVPALLHVWEGMLHAFFVNSPDVPESAEAWRTAAGFFSRELGMARGPIEAQPMPTLYTMDCGRFFMKDADAYADDGSYKGMSRDMVNPCYLIRHPSGDLLWDLGMPDGLARSHGRLTSGLLTLTMPTTLVSQLAELGLAPADMDYISASHGHVDHIGNAALFSGATLLIDARERAYLSRPDVRHRTLTIANAQANEVAGAFSMLEKMKAVEIPHAEAHDVFGDGSVMIHPAPGHTPGHRVLLVRLHEFGPVLLAGDLYHLAESRARRTVPRTNERAETLASFDAVEKLAAEAGAKVIRQHVSDDFYALPPFPEGLR